MTNSGLPTNGPEPTALDILMLRGAERIARRDGDVGLAEAIARLLRRYVVHHIDGNPRNNDPANLRLVCLESRDA